MVQLKAGPRSQDFGSKKQLSLPDSGRLSLSVPASRRITPASQLKLTQIKIVCGICACLRAPLHLQRNRQRYQILNLAADVATHHYGQDETKQTSCAFEAPKARAEMRKLRS